MTTDGVVLYRLETGEHAPPHDAVCPHVALVMAAWTRPLRQTLTLLLAANTRVSIRFECGLAYLPIVPTLYEPMFASLEMLLDDVPDLCAWLAAWTASPARTPDLTPAWAVRRGVDAESVRMLAKAITLDVAASKAQRVRIESTCGKARTLRIPARAELVAQPDGAKQSQVTHVKDVISYQTAVTPMGTLVHIPAAAIPEMSGAGVPVQIRTAWTRRTPAQVARMVRIYREGEKDED